MPDSATSDAQLVDQWLKDGREAAFHELVQRYHGLVRGAAYRTCSDDTLADEAAQLTFISLARKAGSLSSKVALAGWLHITAVLNARNLSRKQQREIAKRHQLTRHMETEPSTELPADAWRRMQPVLDAAMAALSSRDRETLLMRFYRSQSIREIAATLGVAPPAAQKRLERAVQRMRGELARRGCAVGVALPAVMQSGFAVDAALSFSSTMAISTKALTVAGSTASIVLPLLGVITMTKKTIAATTALILLLAGVTTLIVLENRRDSALDPSGAFSSPLQEDSPALPGAAGGTSGGKFRTRPAAQYPDLVAKYGESRVSLSKDVVLKAAAAAAIQGRYDASQKEDRSRQLLQSLKESGVVPEPQQREKIGGLLKDFEERRHERISAQATRLKDHPEAFMPRLLAADAQASGQLSNEDYRAFLKQDRANHPNGEAEFDLVISDHPLDDEKLVTGLDEILTPEQQLAVGTANEARIDLVKSQSGGEVPAVSLEKMLMRFEGASVMYEGMLKAFGNPRSGIPAGSGK